MSFLETKVLTSSFVSLPKSGVIKMRDNFANSSLSSWQNLLVGTGISSIGLLHPVTGMYSYVAGVMYGILTVFPTNKQRIAADLGRIADQMNNNGNVIIEFQEELVYSTINDYLNNRISERNLLSPKSWASTGTTYIPTSSIGDFLGL